MQIRLTTEGISSKAGYRAYIRVVLEILRVVLEI